MYAPSERIGPGTHAQVNGICSRAGPDVRGRAVRVGPVPVPGVLADEPAEVGEQVGDRAARRPANRAPAAANGAAIARGAALDAGDLAARRGPRPGSGARTSTKNDRAVHLTAQASPNMHAGDQPPRPRARASGTPSVRSAPSAISAPAGRASGRGRRRARRSRRRRRTAGRCRAARCATARATSPSSAMQQAGDGAEQVRAEHPPGDAGEDDDRRGMPKIAGAIRQPNASCALPNRSDDPTAISHLPSGGWTMNM